MNIFIGIIKYFIVPIILFLISREDIKSKTVPYKYLLLLVLFLILISILNEFLISNLMVFIGILIVMSVIAMLFKNSLGFGDVLIFSIIGSIYGLKEFITVLTFSTFLVFIFSVIKLIIQKQRELGETLPYVPFIFLSLLIKIVLLIWE
ncbi:MAG: prepilin peptidase [Clostridiales bacterium]